MNNSSFIVATFIGALMALVFVGFGFYMGRTGLPVMDGITCQWVLPQPMLME